jgi:hypothetical protein
MLSGREKPLASTRAARTTAEHVRHQPLSIHQPLPAHPNPPVSAFRISHSAFLPASLPQIPVRVRHSDRTPNHAPPRPQDNRPIHQLHLCAPNVLPFSLHPSFPLPQIPVQVRRSGRTTNHACPPAEQPSPPPTPQCANLSFNHSDLIRHSSFDIRHSSFKSHTSSFCLLNSDLFFLVFAKS